MRTLRLSALLVLAAAMPAAAQQEPTLDKARVDAAIKKGLAWLKTRQAPDGSFDDGYKVQFPTGPTALVALTLAKVGDPKDKATRAAFHYLQSAPLKKTYGVGILLMALEAKFAPSKAQLIKSGEPYKSGVRKRAKRAKAPDKRQLHGGAAWLMKSKATPMWGYPGFPGGEWDHSNTQYALLGLGAASRMGFRPPPGKLLEVLDALLANQEKTGPDFKPSFFVPAADAAFKDIDKLAKELAKARAKTGSDDPAKNGSRPRIREFHETFKPGPMKARGWAYLSLPGGIKSKHPAEPQAHYHQPNNSMTAACLAAVIVLKSLLERVGAYKKRYKTRVDQSIRDGAAYLAKNWTTHDQGHPYYYLYGLERVGVLTGCHQFGDHWWYHEGGKQLLARQNPDGSWGKAGNVANGGMAQPPNALPQTCFAILFLARATVPLVPKLPPRPKTGG